MGVRITNGEPSEKILIIARNMLYVNEWCREHGVNPKSRNVKFVSGITHLYGVKGAYYVDLGTDDIEFRTLLEGLKILGHIKPFTEVLTHSGKMQGRRPYLVILDEAWPISTEGNSEEQNDADASSSRGPEETP
jgi:hypothetical protein